MSANAPSPSSGERYFYYGTPQAHRYFHQPPPPPQRPPPPKQPPPPKLLPIRGPPPQPLPPPYFHPLVPPPLPTVFPLATPIEISPPLPFMPVKVKLNCSESPVLSKESHLGGVIDESMPRELKDLFEPLHCKLCNVPLSSTVVAMAHYKGKKHKKNCDVWCKQNNHHSVGPTGSNATSLGRKEVPRGRGLNPGIGAGQSPRSQPQKRPLSTEWTNKKVQTPENRKAHKKRKLDGSGPNFAFCLVCDVDLTSQKDSDQHNSGKRHKAALLKATKTGNFEFQYDPRFGIGTAHLLANQNQTKQIEKNEFPGTGSRTETSLKIETPK